MDGIKSTDKNELDTLNSELFQAIKDIAPNWNKEGGSKKFGDVARHPDRDEWVLIIKKSGFYWATIEKKLTKEQKERIEPITEDWFEPLEEI